jgi:hypothetical protein
LQARGVHICRHRSEARTMARSARRRIDFDKVREIALTLPDIEASESPRGPSLKMHGKLMACPAIHRSAEPDSLMVRVDSEQRERLMAAEPDTYYVTEHYIKHPAVLVRLSRISLDSLANLLGISWRFLAERNAR